MKKLFWLPLAFAFAFFTSCDDADDPVIPNEEELITTVELTLTPTDETLSATTWTWRDIDGEGGNTPVITAGDLIENTTYLATLRFLDESGAEVEDITEEVEEEADEHQVFYMLNNGITYEYIDADGDGNPIGLEGRLTTAASGDATIQIILLHEPMKNAEGVSEGNMANAEGETDIDVTFTTRVQ